jgi:hypothetical protein
MDTRARVPFVRFRRRWLAGSLCLAGLAGTLGCYLHVRTRLVAPAARRPPVCPEAVRVYARATDAPASRIEVARVGFWWPPDMRAPTVTDLADRLRLEAAKFGATAVVLGDTTAYEVRRRPDGTRLFFIPGDSARAASVCAAARQTFRPGAA